MSAGQPDPARGLPEGHPEWRFLSLSWLSRSCGLPWVSHPQRDWKRLGSVDRKATLVTSAGIHPVPLAAGTVLSPQRRRVSRFAGTVTKTASSSHHSWGPRTGQAPWEPCAGMTREPGRGPRPAEPSRPVTPALPPGRWGGPLQAGVAEAAPRRVRLPVPGLQVEKEAETAPRRTAGRGRPQRAAPAEPGSCPEGQSAGGAAADVSAGTDRPSRAGDLLATREVPPCDGPGPALGAVYSMVVSQPFQVAATATDQVGGPALPHS